MGQALVIKGADFSSVAVDHITFSQVVPCTGITLGTMTGTLEYIGDTATIPATVTPVDCTETTTWTSSNENVATVSNGTVTVHGIGTATITATCGNYSDSIDITQSTIKASAICISGVYPDKLSDNDLLITLFNSGSQKTVGAPYDGNADVKIRNGASNGLQAFAVPYGAVKAQLHTTNDSSIYGYLIRGSATERVTYESEEFAKFVSKASATYTSAQSVSTGECFIYRGGDANMEYADYVIFTAS